MYIHPVVLKIYWEQLIQNSNITIAVNGKYVPKELNSICSDNEQPRLHLIIQSHHEQDSNQLEDVCSQIYLDLVKFQYHDLPHFDHNFRQMLVYGSLYNSLPDETFEIDRYLLGQRNSHIKRIRHTLECAIDVERLSSYRYRFTIRHEKQSIMNLAAIQIQALVRQAQDQYIIAFATSIGRSLSGSSERSDVMETSSSNAYDFPSFTPFQSMNKRRREDDVEQTTTNTSIITVSDQSDDESTTSETRYDDDDNNGGLDSNSTLNTSPVLDASDHHTSDVHPFVDQFCVLKLERRREDMEHLLDRICKRMRDRTPKDDVAKAREDSSQIKSYFRNPNTSKHGSIEPESALELVEHEIDLRTRNMSNHKCTLVFNKQLKMGAGVCDRLKRTAKVLAYKQLMTMTRDTPREYLKVKPTKDGFWKAIIDSSQSQ
ncbi:unnamed protein product [Adineta ricciae]|uniref:Uncharacterized protein n=1 Tax=Adineta ricciae TaxID=249248 RepID=A0A813ZMA5_ADIRI|nr:unnamed protein product [Adineta ricciae]